MKAGTNEVLKRPRRVRADREQTFRQRPTPRQAAVATEEPILDGEADDIAQAG